MGSEKSEVDKTTKKSEYAIMYISECSHKQNKSIETSPKRSLWRLFT